jgi:hypothetical protein
MTTNLSVLASWRFNVGQITTAYKQSESRLPMQFELDDFLIHAEALAR